MSIIFVDICTKVLLLGATYILFCIDRLLEDILIGVPFKNKTRGEILRVILANILVFYLPKAIGDPIKLENVDFTAVIAKLLLYY